MLSFIFGTLFGGIVMLVAMSLAVSASDCKNDGESNEKNRE